MNPGEFECSLRCIIYTFESFAFRKTFSHKYPFAPSCVRADFTSMQRLMDKKATCLGNSFSPI